jgi:hypothetical protein
MMAFLTEEIIEKKLRLDKAFLYPIPLSIKRLLYLTREE